MQQEWQGFSSFTRWMNDGEHCRGPWASAWGTLIGNDSCLKCDGYASGSLVLRSSDGGGEGGKCSERLGRKRNTTYGRQSVSPTLSPTLSLVIINHPLSQGSSPLTNQGAGEFVKDEPTTAGVFS